MGEYLQRRCHTQTVTIASGAAVSDAFDFHLFSMMILLMPAAWTSASVGFKVCPTEDGTYLPLYDADGDIVEVATPSVNCAYDTPAIIPAAHWVKLWSQDGSGNDTNQGAERVVTLMMKA